MRGAEISRQALQRLPLYFNYLKSLPSGTRNISATSIADELGLHDVQVRKDLALVSSGGRPKTGYITQNLMADIRGSLMCKGDIRSVIVGMGSLGRALALHDGFAEYGLQVAAAFDSDPSLRDRSFNGIRVFPVNQLERICTREKARIGIITVSPPQAQSVCDRLAAAGIMAIWNFTPTHINTPDGVLVQNEDMAASLAILTRHLAQILDMGGESQGSAEEEAR